jgi:DNA-binding transcriptional LysR family regulator
MDTELLRTFLEVRQTRHFARAARNLALTQAAVSARIRQLEELVGQQLFTRTRNNIQLTEAGRRLLPYAESVLSSWNRALLELSATEGLGPALTVGCLPSLREVYLDSWLALLLQEPVGVPLRVESWNTAELIQRLREGALSLGIVYEPPRAADLWTELLTRFELLLVATRSDATLASGLPGYVYVDWGLSFAAAHNRALSWAVPTRLGVDSPVLARQLLLEGANTERTGGSAYLAGPMVAAELSAGRLFVVADAPVMTREVYLVGSRERENPALDALVAALARLAGRGDPQDQSGPDAAP